MARRSPLVATLRRLDKVDATLYDDAGERRGGVMLVPPIMSLEVWEAHAVPMQAALAHACREDLPVPTAPQRKLKPATAEMIR